MVINSCYYYCYYCCCYLKEFSRVANDGNFVHFLKKSALHIERLTIIIIINNNNNNNNCYRALDQTDSCDILRDYSSTVKLGNESKVFDVFVLFLLLLLLMLLLYFNIWKFIYNYELLLLSFF